jgi:glyoxylase-like metal-dependent hydrolase (beta-lactamase superfamily II)
VIIDTAHIDAAQFPAMKKCLLLLCLTLCCGSIQLRAQDGKASLEAISTALGAANLRSIEFSGRGFDYIFGQPYDTNSPWPRFAVPTMTVSIDYATPAMRDDRRRQQYENPPLGGGFQPLAGELRQIWLMSGSYAWEMAGTMAVPSAPERDFRSAVDGRLTQIWATPQGFIKAAIANGGTARSETVRGMKKTIVTFTAPNKAKFEGMVGDQNLVERIETWYGSPVLGDTKFEADFSAYKDFGGVKFPTHISQRNGPYPILDLTVTEVKPNAPVAIEVPANIRNAPPAGPATLQAEKISDGIWMVQGTAKSVALEMKDHIVMIEAPETEARSIAVIDAVRRAIPGKPIKYLINTHHHFDHAGGLRTYAAEGATIITYHTNIPFYENTWRNPRTINPDRLSKSGRTPVFEGVTGNRVLSDGAREIDIYHYGGNMHNPGMLMIYMPRERMLIEADSWTPPAVVGDVPGAVVNLVNFYEAVERLQLDVDQVVPIHGRLTTFDEIRQAVQTYGKTQYWTN